MARTVREAIDVADQALFDLLISDIRLPDGSGLDLMRRLRSNHPIRGIAISGFGTEQDQRRPNPDREEFDFGQRDSDVSADEQSLVEHAIQYFNQVRPSEDE